MAVSRLMLRQIYLTSLAQVQAEVEALLLAVRMDDWLVSFAAAVSVRFVSSYHGFALAVSLPIRTAGTVP